MWEGLFLSLSLLTHHWSLVISHWSLVVSSVNKKSGKKWEEVGKSLYL